MCNYPAEFEDRGLVGVFISGAGGRAGAGGCGEGEVGSGVGLISDLFGLLRAGSCGKEIRLRKRTPLAEENSAGGLHG